MTATNIPATQTTVAIWDGFYSPQPPLGTYFFLSQLAPDGKIYINCGNSTLDIHVINSPDSLGLACNICQHCIHLPALNAFTIPNYPNYFLGPEIGTLCDSLNIGIDESDFKNIQVQIFPNPVINHEMTITYLISHMPIDLTIINLLGEQVAHFILPPWTRSQTIRLPELSPGVYLGRLQNSSVKGNIKFLVE